MVNKAYDSLINADADDTFTAMYAAVDVNQKKPPGVQIAATAILFRLLCERFGVEMQDVFTATGNMLSAVHYERRVQVAAARQYLKEELK